jgi:acetamidase/formamidase
MIETNVINHLPMIVHHRVKGPMSIHEAMTGVADALSVMKQAVSLSERLHLILDMRGYIFDSLDSHKIWKTEFTQNSLLSEHVECVAAIGAPGPKLIAEKELMESDKLKFFTDFNLAFQWLRNKEIY